MLPVEQHGLVRQDLDSQVLGGTGLALSEPIVPRRVRISSVKLSEFLQTAY